MTDIAFVASNPQALSLQHNNDVIALRLNVSEPGEYLVFGRVVIENYDGDFQAASARLTSQDGGNILDRASIGAPRGAGNTVYLQGTLIVPPGAPQTVSIRCSTFNGMARASSLFAQRVHLRFG